MGTDQILKLLTYKFMELTFKNIYIHDKPYKRLSLAY